MNYASNTLQLRPDTGDCWEILLNIAYTVVDNTELKQVTFLSHERKPEVNISHARTVVSPRFSN